MVFYFALKIALHCPTLRTPRRRQKKMNVTIRMTDEQRRIADSYAKCEGVSLSQAIKKAFFEAVEDKHDAMIGDAAMEEHEKNPDAISWEEFEKELDSKKK